MNSQNIRPSDQATPVSAIVLVITACFLFSFLDTSAKYLAQQGLAPAFLAWSRFAVHLILVLIMFRAWQNRAMFRVVSFPAQIVRGGFLFGSTMFNFLAVQYLQLAETISIYFFGPMVITALAGPLLGEWAGWRRWVAIIVGFIGVLIIVRPGFEAVGIGHFYSILSMLSYCIYVIMTRRMGARESAESMIFYSALAPTLLMLPAVPVYASMPQDAVQWVLLLMLGVFGGGGHWLLIKAYKQATTSALAPYPYTQMIWMISLGWLVFADLPDMWTLVGAGIIVLSGLYILQRERQLRLQNKARLDVEAK